MFACRNLLGLLLRAFPELPEEPFRAHWEGQNKHMHFLLLPQGTDLRELVSSGTAGKLTA